MIDNFELIKAGFKFDTEHDFYFVQIIQRKKEVAVTGSNNHNRLIKAYYIFSIEQLDRYKDEIVKMCEMFSARAYIHLNSRNARSLSLEMMQELAHLIQCEQYGAMSKIYNTVCGRHSSKQKSWVVDIDTKDESVIENTIAFIDSVAPFGNKIIMRVPTKQGVHLVTKRFDTRDFIYKCPDVSIHKNNPIILYIP